MSSHHLAQFNVADLKQPLEHPDTTDFREAVDPIHAIADDAPGFVWRMVSEERDDATEVRPLGEDGIINFTVWESREALEAFVYAGPHLEALRRRREWFHPPTQPSVVLWWIPVGHTPPLQEALDRLERLRLEGPSPDAFGPRDRYPAPTSS